MKVQLLSSQQIDPQKWDRFVRSSRQGAVYHEYGTLSALCTSWSALLISDGDWKAVFPFERKRKYFIRYSFPTMFTQFLGPVIALDSQDESTELSRLLAKRFRTMGRSLVANFSPRYEFDRAWGNAGFKVEERVTHWLSLDRSFEDIQKAYSENIRRNIKKGKKRFEIKVNELDVKAAVDLFREEVGASLAISETQYAGFIKWIGSLQDEDRATIYSAKTQDGTCAGFAIIVHSGTHRIYSMGALRAEWRNSGLSPLLLSSAIGDAIDDGAAIFDFEGSMVEGIARFFKSFGSEKVIYNTVSLKKFPFGS